MRSSALICGCANAAGPFLESNVPKVMKEAFAKTHHPPVDEDRVIALIAEVEHRVAHLLAENHHGIVPHHELRLVARIPPAATSTTAFAPAAAARGSP